MIWANKEKKYYLFDDVIFKTFNALKQKPHTARLSFLQRFSSSVSLLSRLAIEVKKNLFIISGVSPDDDLWGRVRAGSGFCQKFFLSGVVFFEKNLPQRVRFGLLIGDAQPRQKKMMLKRLAHFL